MTYFALAKTNMMPSRAEERDARPGRTGKSTSLFFVLAGSLILLGGIYVFAINAIVGDTYELRTITKQVEDLRDQNKLLETQAAQKSALPVLESRISGLNLVAIDKIDYIDVNTDTSLALSR